MLIDAQSRRERPRTIEILSSTRLSVFKSRRMHTKQHCNSQCDYATRTQWCIPSERRIYNYPTPAVAKNFITTTISIWTYRKTQDCFARRHINSIRNSFNWNEFRFYSIRWWISFWWLRSSVLLVWTEINNNLITGRVNLPLHRLISKISGRNTRLKWKKIQNLQVY